jgi:hypothetical protein
LYRGLAESFAGFPGLLINDCALSDKAGTARFQHVVSNPGYSGFRRRIYCRPSERVREISVKTETLDRLAPGKMPIHFIKSMSRAPNFKF